MVKGQGPGDEDCAVNRNTQLSFLAVVHLSVLNNIVIDSVEDSFTFSASSFALYLNLPICSLVY